MAEVGLGSAPGASVVAMVKWYDPVKGYGFLTSVDGSGDLFCHVSALGPAGLLTLAEGATVTCEVMQGRQGPQVGWIYGVDDSTATPVGAASGGTMHGEHGQGNDGRGASPGRRVVATVKWFVPGRGFGFLIPDDGSADVFCHVSVVEEAGYGTLAQGAGVTCEVVEGRRGPIVSSIVSVDASTAMLKPASRAGPGHERRDRSRSQDWAGNAVEERYGFVKFYNAAKGYGFVVPDEGGPDVFVHASVLSRSGLAALEPGQRVSVMVEQGARGPQATDVVPI